MTSVDCNKSDNTTQEHSFSATKRMKYSNIQPHPIEEDGKMHKVAVNCPPIYNSDQTQSVLRRNARERNRVKQVNNSFSRLRQHIPQAIITDLTKGGGRGPQKKISKVDTLRIAVEYIRRLQDLLEDLNGATSTQSQPQFQSQNNSNCDSASNSSFSSSLSTGSSSPASFINTTTPIYYIPPVSPLPSQLDVHLQLPSDAYNNSALLSPESLSSYSPPAIETIESQTSNTTLRTSLPYDTLSAEQNHPPLIQQELQQHFQQNEQITPPHFDGTFQLKFEPYDNFALDEEDCTPDDDEILHYISLWQEQ